MEIDRQITEGISKVEVLDKANYFGLIEGKQIMFCTHRSKDEYIVLWCKKEKSSPKYGLSTEGQKFSETKVFHYRSSFIGKITYLSIIKNDLDLWNELYEEKLFPFWDPKLGPFKYNEEKLYWIALCQVFKTQVIIEKQDIGLGQTSRTLKNSVKIGQLKNDLINMIPILPNQLFLDKKNQIETIINKYKKSDSINSEKLLSSEDSVSELPLIEENEELTFPEGKEKFLLHKSKERNKDLVRKAKELYFKKDNNLSCQNCGFSFFNEYGEIGKGFIEAHHIVPISELIEETNTKIEDLAMLCSNCHRMVHRERPWLTIELLKAAKR